MLRLLFIGMLAVGMLTASAQRSMRVRKDVPLDSIRLSDPAILADKASQMYYMTGTGGMMWRSADLKLWEGPFRVTEFEADSWMGPRPMIWAAELHRTDDDWYYYFATFTNQAVKIDTVRGNVIERRASQVLRADNPMGPYRAFGDATYLPADRPTLDGTFWRDVDGKPYMVYCGEWLQNWNGTIEKIELKPDLSGTIGEPTVLFRASDSPWSRERNDEGEITWNKVTDGPWLFRTATGRLGMLWTSWVYDVYTQGVAYSESGTLDGPWIQEPDPITPPGYGHSMLFQRFDGQWMMSVHYHQKDARGRTVRTPHLFEVDLSGEKLSVRRKEEGVRSESEMIRRNQVGYYLEEEKVIVVEGMDPTGKIEITTPDGKRVTPEMKVREAISPLSQKRRYVVDLGELKAKGCYSVRIGEDSCEIKIADRPYQDIAKAALRLFYLIRSGVAIKQGGVYNRELGHPDTCVVVHNSAASALRPAGTVISSPFGWYDAGDYNKYVVNSAFSIGLMLAAYEQQRDYFDRLRTDIPESGNTTPDLLDEMMFNLRWLLTMQDPYDGGVYHKLTTPNFEAFIMPTACRQQRYVVAKSVTATLDFAAVMADAARLFKAYGKDYPGFAEQAAAAAEQAYQWAKEHPTAFYRQWELKDPEVSTGTYGDRNASDEFFWAASALYRLTGKASYLDDARQHQPQRFTTPSWGNVASLGAFEWMAGSPSDPLSKAMLEQLLAYCEGAVKDVATSSFKSPFGNSPRDFGWGCLAEKCCCQALALLYADKMTGKATYRRYALQNADYLLGRNATGYCYVTGFGDKSPMHPHHRISAADNVEAPFPGMLVGGPNPGQQDKEAMRHGVYPSSVPDESYIDHTESYASNEIAINWNASLVAFLGWLDAVGTDGK